MAITKRPTKQDEKQADAFISAAPDAQPETETTGKRGRPFNKVKRSAISHTLSPQLLEQLDQRAQEVGISRSSLINLAIAEYLEKK